MNITTTIEETRYLIQQAKQEGKRVAFVPTMGNLHEGHLSLVRKAKELADFVIVSIYVNPMQFGPNEDFDSYPRTFENDCQQLIKEQADAIFAPTTTVIYPEGKENHTTVQVDSLDGMHCGASRPQFFTGIATVVIKLLNIVTPDIAILGEKDFQQLCIIKKMVRDLMLPIEIVGVPTARAENGLALSSRNNYLSAEKKTQASQLNTLMLEVADKIRDGQKDYVTLSEYSLNKMVELGFKPDYFNIVNSSTLKLPEPDDKALVILAACTLDETRLIDNIQIQLV